MWKIAQVPFSDYNTINIELAEKGPKILPPLEIKHNRTSSSLSKLAAKKAIQTSTRHLEMDSHDGVT